MGCSAGSHDTSSRHLTAPATYPREANEARILRIGCVLRRRFEMASHPRFDGWPSALLDMMAGHRITAVIYVAAGLGIPGALAPGPRAAPAPAPRNGQTR